MTCADNVLCGRAECCGEAMCVAGGSRQSHAWWVCHRLHGSWQPCTPQPCNPPPPASLAWPPATHQSLKLFMDSSSSITTFTGQP